MSIAVITINKAELHCRNTLTLNLLSHSTNKKNYFVFHDEDDDLHGFFFTKYKCAYFTTGLSNIIYN